jgi:hypothetical protein
MGNIPVLKPTEAVAILQRIGFVEVRQRGLNSFGILMVAGRQFLSTEAETSPPFYFVKLQQTSI